MQTKRLNYCVFLGCLFRRLSLCYADFATPFVDVHQNTGDVSTAHGYVVALGPDMNSRFPVIVMTDTMNHIIPQATAKKEAVKKSLLGRENKITAAITKAGSATTKPGLEILHTEPLHTKVKWRRQEVLPPALRPTGHAAPSPAVPGSLNE